MSTRWRVAMFRLSLLMTVITFAAYVFQRALGLLPATTDQVWILLLGNIFTLPFEVPSWTVVAVGPVMTPILVAATWYMWNSGGPDLDDFGFTRTDLILLLVWFSVLVSYIVGLAVDIVSGLINLFALSALSVVVTYLLVAAHWLFVAFFDWVFAAKK